MEKQAKIELIAKMKIKEDIARMKEHDNKTFRQHSESLIKKMQSEFQSLEVAK